jgi:hypothetical protein
MTVRALSAGCRGARGACGLHLDAGRSWPGHPGAQPRWQTRIKPAPPAQHMLGTALSNQRLTRDMPPAGRAVPAGAAGRGLCCTGPAHTAGAADGGCQAVLRPAPRVPGPARLGAGGCGGRHQPGCARPRAAVLQVSIHMGLRQHKAVIGWKTACLLGGTAWTGCKVMR